MGAQGMRLRIQDEGRMDASRARLFGEQHTLTPVSELRIALVAPLHLEAVDFLCTGKEAGILARGSHARENDKPGDTRLVVILARG
jgi:hypothetical protein